MEPPLSDVDFSISEFEQAGLLNDTDAVPDMFLIESPSFTTCLTDQAADTCSNTSTYIGVQGTNLCGQAET